MKTSTKRIIVWGGLALVIAVLIGLGMRPTPLEVEIAVIDRGILEQSRSHEGLTRVRDRFVVSAPVAGRLLRIELEPGDPVIAGESVLATFLPLEPVPLDARTRATAKARVDAAAASLARSQADRARAAAELELARKEVDRWRALSAGGVLSAADLDNAETAVEARSEALAAAQAAVAAARSELEATNAALIEPAGSSSGAATIVLRSPVDGVVLKRLQESESVLQTGTPLVEVADLSDLEVVADFLSRDAVRIEPGMAARLDAWGGEVPLDARVRRVEPAGFMKVSALGVEEQRVWVVLDFAGDLSERARLGDGYRVEAEVVLWRGEGVLTVPISSLQRRGEQWAVWLLKGDRVTAVTLEIDHRNALYAEVVSGLSEGDQVVVHPPTDIGPDRPIVIRGAR